VDTLFESLEKKLVLVIAPAGYGKTSLLVDFIDVLEFPVCWYSISAHDQDPLRFFAHFISSIQQKFPDFGQSSLTALHNASEGTLDLHYLVSTVINDAFTNIAEHFVITLEDFHLVDDVDPISEFISDFIQGIDDNCTVIITSRKLLTLPDMTLLVARNMVGGISYQELAFTPEDIQHLYLQNHQQSLTDDTAKTFADQTEGWITGLRLVVLSIRQREDLERILSNLPDNNRYVMEYLVEEVLSQQPLAIQEYLLATSILNRFCAPLCDVVCASSTSSELREIQGEEFIEWIEIVSK
jgi:LuxR family maltose regulon positive regulatory protein